MKKKNRFLTAALIVCVAVCMATFAACAPAKSEGVKTVKFLVGDQTIDYVGEEATVGQVLRKLKTEGKLTLDANESEWGLYINGIGSLTADSGKNEFIAFLSSSTDVTHAGSLIPVEKDGVNYFSTNKGVDDMPLLDGITYLFMIDTF